MKQAESQKKISRGPWSFITVSWIEPLLKIGKSRAIAEEDLYALPSALSAETLQKNWEPYWKGEKTVTKVLMDSIIVNVLIVAVVELISIAINFWALPFFLGQLVAFIDPIVENDSALLINNGYAIAGILFGFQVIGALLKSVTMTMDRSTTATAENLLKVGLFQKIFKLSPKSRAVYVGSKLINNLNVDCEITAWGTLILNSIWSIPLRLAVAVFFLARTLGVALWPSFSLIVLAAIVTVYSGTFMGPLFGTMMKSSDDRIKGITEAVKGMKVIKYFALEEAIEQSIVKIRDLQIQTVRKLLTVIVLAQGISGVAPVLMPVIAYAFYAKSNPLTPSVVFSSLLLFKNLSSPLGQAGGLVQQLANAKSSYNRLLELFVAEEETKEDSKGMVGVVGDISIKNAEFHYPTDKKESTETTLALKVADLDIPAGSLVGIVGKVGAGKTTLFNALLEDVIKVQGQVIVNGSIGYCSQKSVLFNGTIKENILFSSEWDTERLEKVLEMCCLKDDLKMFPNGVDTKLGENGASLSGGQMARVSLARAIYQRPDIYLLDDPLSALDATVGAQIFTNVIQNRPAEKTILLATHQLHYMSKMDKIIVVEEGIVVEYGTFAELIAQDGVFGKIMEKYSHEETEATKTTETTKEIEQTDADKDDDIVKKETSSEGSVKLEIYKKYFRSMGVGVSYSFIAVFLIGTALKTSVELWLMNGTQDPNLSTNTFILFYSILAGSSAFSDIFTFWWVARATVTAAEMLHAQALSGIFAAPISFFESNPTGRILNRFTADTESVDIGFINVALGMMQALLVVVVSLILVAQASWILLLILICLAVFFYSIFQYYQKSNLSMKRLMALLKSPLLSTTSQTIDGLVLLKAYKRESETIEKFRQTVDGAESPSYIKSSLNIWVNLRLNLLSSVITFSVLLVSITIKSDASSIGLALVNSLSLSEMLYRLMLVAGEGEAELNAVERLYEYGNSIPREKARLLPSDPKEQMWPTLGSIEIKNVDVRYTNRPDRPVIKDFSLLIRPGEKIGICGRTGSGKSTLATTLFRTLELYGGQIIVDGKDISTLGLKTLRSRIQMIPQDPILFNGTMRSNLDPENAYTDDLLWDAIESVGLKDYIQSLEAKLDAPVEDNGGNLSFGQKQLMCIARAVLKKPKILVMDEASSGIDQETETMIQELVMNQFPSATVISIAHRLNTIAEFDKILVLGDGELVEFDKPKVLLSTDSEFSRLVDASGPANAKLIRSMVFK